MAWFRRRGGKAGAGTRSPRDYRADLEHLEQFVRTRTGVEAYVEPRTTVTETTVILLSLIHISEPTRPY